MGGREGFVRGLENKASSALSEMYSFASSTGNLDLVPVNVLEDQEFSVDSLESNIHDAIKSLESMSDEMRSHEWLLGGPDDMFAFYDLRLSILKSVLITYVESDRSGSRKVAAYAVHVLSSFKDSLSSVAL